MKSESRVEDPPGGLCLTGLCLGTGAALAAGDADDPLVTLRLSQ